MLDARLTLVIARIFRRILPLLITNLPTLEGQDSSQQFYEKREIVSSALSKVLPLCPQCLGYVLVRVFACVRAVAVI